MAHRYDVVTANRAGKERSRRYTTGERLAPGAVLRLDGRDRLVERVEPDGRVVARPARNRIRLKHPEGRRALSRR